MKNYETTRLGGPSGTKGVQNYLKEVGHVRRLIGDRREIVLYFKIDGAICPTPYAHTHADWQKMRAPAPD